MTASRAIVVEGTGGVWRVRSPDGTEREAALAGRLKQEERGALKLAVGDHVTVEPDERGGGWRITEIAPRGGVLARREPGGRRGERILAANVDQVLVVFAVAKPDPHPRMIDRFLVVCEANDLHAHLVINKVDLADSSAPIDALVAPYLAAGYPVHRTSAKRGDGLETLRAELHGRVTAVTGPSGAGKSSLLNALHPELDLRTQEISASVNKGRHTTVGAKLIPLPDGDEGYLVDTPGLREVGMWGLPSGSLDQCFPEFRPYLGECRFQDCQHDREPGCAVRGAVDTGLVDAGRHESYLKLRGELAEAERTEF
ncbi:MAG: ribosome small subunit-dependent GTPase A [Gemmatimonadales bacterium]|nr:ribosome small subunit-dependent GTPase A [Gemmatimonadota bacterium]MCL4213281.1 ribosome small subunit-dependent GTPase A [Gemmatimonadales bacterium]